jgi:hypothetical protein
MEASCHHRAFTFCQVVHNQCKFFLGQGIGPKLPQRNTASYKLKSWFNRTFKRKCTSDFIPPPSNTDYNSEDNSNVTASSSNQSSDSSSSPPVSLPESQQSDSTSTQLAAVFHAKTVQLQRLQQCQGCQTEQVQVAFYPCGHAIYCKNCASTDDTCSVCTIKIKSHLQIYWA